ncbi:class I SAM-dependent methyltransferase [Nocardioides sp.]|uniref:class I SAM-dependent methyltransferase n=1 Tax=Nocardioides sp. TaxID=35761 RepID=UPI00263641E6|nr:class I SAM-dependent methyltransferase [Nocardioides sp.]
MVSAATRLKRAYVASARVAGQGLIKAGIASADVPPVEDRWAHWRHSLTKIYDSVAMMELDVPWWTYDAIAEVDAWLAARRRGGRPLRVFEYGSGASTLWLSSRVDEVFTVENDRSFGELMAQRFADIENISLRVVEPVASPAPLITSAKDGYAGQDFSDYVHAIDDVVGEFDLVVVDGRAREACLAYAAPRVAPGGIILVDNSRRRRYRDAIAASGLVERRLPGLTPTLPYPDQTSLLTAR